MYILFDRKAFVEWVILYMFLVILHICIFLYELFGVFLCECVYVNVCQSEYVYELVRMCLYMNVIQRACPCVCQSVCVI